MEIAVSLFIPENGFAGQEDNFLVLDLTENQPLIEFDLLNLILVIKISRSKGLFKLVLITDSW